MSNEYREKRQQDSIREADVDHFRKFKAAENFLHRVVKGAHALCDEQDSAIKAGVDSAVAMFGHRPEKARAGER